MSQLCHPYVGFWLFVHTIMQGVVTSVLRGSARDRYKVDAALKYCKAFLCTLKGEERRKVHMYVLMFHFDSFCTYNIGYVCMQHAYNTVANIAHDHCFAPYAYFSCRCLAGNHMRVHDLSPHQS